MGVVINNPELAFEYEVFSDGSVLNRTTNKIIKPSKDKRRPGKCPIIYMTKKDGKRVFTYQDKLVAQCFIPEYVEGKTPIYHKDSNPQNCNVNNICIGHPKDILKNVFGDTSEWKFVELDGVDLIYDYYICRDGRLFNATTGSFIKPFTDKREKKGKNYKRFNLAYGRGPGEIIHVSAARLVAMNFLKPVEGKTIVLYKDGNRENISADNLYYGDNWDSISKDVDANTARVKTFIDIPPLGKEVYKCLNKKFYKWYGIELADEYYVSNYGRIWNETKGFYLAKLNSSGSTRNNQHHHEVNLRINTEKRFMLFGVHILVALCFVKNPDGKQRPIVNHINGNPECNLSINLEWVTPMENANHAIMTNLSHTDRYDDMVDDLYWRLNSILAWIDTFTKFPIEDRYRLYTYYQETYPDNIPELTYDEFLKEYENRKNSSDYIKIKRFYHENYCMYRD